MIMVSSDAAFAAAAARKAAGRFAADAVAQALLQKSLKSNRKDMYMSPKEQLSERLPHGIQCNKFSASGISGRRALLHTIKQ